MAPFLGSCNTGVGFLRMAPVLLCAYYPYRVHARIQTYPYWYTREKHTYWNTHAQYPYWYAIYLAT